MMTLIDAVKQWLDAYDRAPRGAATSTQIMVEPALDVLSKSSGNQRLMDLAHVVGRLGQPHDVAFPARVSALRNALAAAMVPVIAPNMSLLAAAKAYLEDYDGAPRPLVNRAQLRASIARATGDSGALRQAACAITSFDVGSRDVFSKLVEDLRAAVKDAEIQPMRGSGTEVAKIDRVTRRALTLLQASGTETGAWDSFLAKRREAALIDATIKAVLEHLATDLPEPAAPTVEAPKPVTATYVCTAASNPADVGKTVTAPLAWAAVPKPPAIKVGDRVRLTPQIHPRPGYAQRVWIVDRITGNSARLCIGFEAIAVSCADLEIVPEARDTEADVAAKLLRDFEIRDCPSSVLAVLKKIARISVKNRNKLSDDERALLGVFQALGMEPA